MPPITGRIAFDHTLVDCAQYFAHGSADHPSSGGAFLLIVAALVQRLPHGDDVPGRNAQGVKLIELEEGQKLQAVAPVISEQEEEAATAEASASTTALHNGPHIRSRIDVCSRKERTFSGWR